MIRRGDLATVALQGDFGKPRPALIIQSDHIETSETVTILVMTGTLVDAPLLRVTVHPSAANGLRIASQVMIDKLMTVGRTKVGGTFGTLDATTMQAVERRLAIFLGIAK